MENIFLEAVDLYVSNFGLEFVDYKLVDTTIKSLNTERDRDSVQAVRNGMGEGHKEGGRRRNCVE